MAVGTTGKTVTVTIIKISNFALINKMKDLLHPITNMTRNDQYRLENQG